LMLRCSRSSKPKPLVALILRWSNFHPDFAKAINFVSAD